MQAVQNDELGGITSRYVSGIELVHTGPLISLDTFLFIYA